MTTFLSQVRISLAALFLAVGLVLGLASVSFGSSAPCAAEWGHELSDHHGGLAQYAREDVPCHDTSGCCSGLATTCCHNSIATSGDSRFCRSLSGSDNWPPALSRTLLGVSPHVH